MAYWGSYVEGQPRLPVPHLNLTLQVCVMYMYVINHLSETFNFFYLYVLLPSICPRRGTKSRAVVGYAEICNSSTMFFFFQLLPSFWQIVSHRTLIIILLPTLAIFIAAAAVLTLQIIPILSLDIPLSLLAGRPIHHLSNGGLRTRKGRERSS